MDPYEALQVIQRLARIALASEQGQPAEVLADIQRRALNGHREGAGESTVSRELCGARKNARLWLREIASNRAPCAHFQENGICEIPFRGLLRRAREVRNNRTALRLT
jgi:hypothetical protein